MQTKKKKIYRKPSLAKVNLTIEDAVLACCKTSQAVNPNNKKKLCGASGCASTPTNLT